MPELIESIKAREILDSRGNPTVEVDVVANGILGRESVPSGASTGSHEAVELRDKKRYRGMGVQKAVDNVNDVISPALIGTDVRYQRAIDRKLNELDGTDNKSKLGANTILGVSLACARTSAYCQGMHFFQSLSRIAKTEMKLPIPYMNIINGGRHADNKLDFQEFMIVPQGETFRESLQMAAEIYQELKKIIQKKYGSANVGDEGGFAPAMENHKEALDAIMAAIEKCGYKDKVKLAMDAAASEFYKDEKYHFEGQELDAEGLMKVYEDIVSNYPMISIEDPFHEDAWEDFAELLKRLQDKEIQIVGDDLLCTNPERIKKAIEMKSCNALLLKVNQIGTLSEALDAAQLARDNGWNVMVSHRSGETENHFIADLVVGLGTGQIKAGAPCRGERTAKYNQLLRIEEKLI